MIITIILYFNYYLLSMILVMTGLVVIILVLLILGDARISPLSWQLRHRGLPPGAVLGRWMARLLRERHIPRAPS